MAAQKKLSEVISIEDLPQEVEIQEVASVLDDVDFEITSETIGQIMQYQLNIFLKRIGFTIPGLDIEFVLNPCYRDGEPATKIPVTLDYQWMVLSLLNNDSELAFEGITFLDILDRGLTDENHLIQILRLYYSINDLDELDELDALNQFISEVNERYNLVPAIAGADDVFSADLLTERLDAITHAVGKDILTIIYEMYIEGNSPQETLQNVNRFFDDPSATNGNSPEDSINSIFLPNIDLRLTLHETRLDIIFPRKYLVPLDKDNDLQPFPAETKSILQFDGGQLSFSTTDGFEYQNHIGFELNYPSMIGNTGLIIDIEEAKLDLSRTENIEEAVEDERPEGFIGVFIEKAVIKLPGRWFKNANYDYAEIYGRNLLIGTGGLSGEFGMEAIGENGQNVTEPLITANLGDDDGFEVGLSNFGLTFRQNSITACSISGYLMIKGFKNVNGEDAKIRIMMSIDNEGNFSITADESAGIEVLEFPDVFRITLTSLGVGRQDNRMFIAVSGMLDFLDQSSDANDSFIGDNLPKSIEIQKLIIWQDGSFEFEGGGIPIRKPISMRIGPAELSITAIHFGAHEQEHEGFMREYKYFGFDGGVSIKPGGVDARGDGIKFYFTVDDRPRHMFVRIQSIAIDIIIPGTATPETASVIMKGYLAMKNPSNGNNGSAATEYAGGIELSLPKLKIKGSAAMRFNPKVPAYVVDVGIELPNALLLGSTGLGIYAFRGLLGQRYVASREHIGLPSDAQWWEYYKKKVQPDNKEGIFISKMEQREGFTVGAGASICTYADSGNTFSSKLFFMLSLPDVLLLQGQANFLSERIGIDDPNDPPFFALIAITSTSIQAALGVNYKMPSEGDYAGKIVKLDGVMELAFFWGNSSGWYLNVGRDMPEDKRIEARIFDLFEAYFFLMISSRGISAGAGASLSFDKTYLRAVNVKLQAYMDVRGKISFKPLQLGASIQLGGSFAIRVFGVGFGISAGTGLAAEAPRPLIISGYIYISFEILWWDFAFNVGFTWSINTDLNMDEIPILDTNTANIAKAINMHTGEAFPLLIETVNESGYPDTPDLSLLDGYTIPMDSFIDISFLQGVNTIDAVNNGNDTYDLQRFNDVITNPDYSVLVPPQRGKSPQVKHEFYVQSIKLRIWDKQFCRWINYHPYKAMRLLEYLSNLNLGEYGSFDDYVDGQDFKYGSWQVRQPGKYNFLRVLGTNPLSYTNQNVNLIPEELGITSHTIFCPSPRRREKCIELAGLARPQHSVRKNLVPADTNLVLERVLFWISGKNGRIVKDPLGDVSRALKILPNDKLNIILPEASVKVSLLLKITTAEVKIKYYKRVPTGVDLSHVPVYGWELQSVVNKPASMLTEPVVYNNRQHPVDKIVISASESRPPNIGIEHNGRSEALEEFLNKLIAAGRLGNGRRINIVSGAYSQHFVPLLQSGKLWNVDGKGGVYLQSRFNADASIFILVTSISPSWRCELKLASRQVSSLRNVKFVRFDNLRPDPNIIHEGDNHDFLVDAEFLLNGIKNEATFKGSSCIPLRTNEPAENISLCEINDQGTNMIALLELLAQKKRLVQARKLNISRGKYANELSGIKHLNLFDPKGSLYYQSRLVSSNDLSMRMNFDLERKYIFLETENEGFKGFAFGKITSFENLRPDMSRKSLGERRFFHVDATCGSQSITLNGSTNINIYEQISAEGIHRPPSAPQQPDFTCEEITPEAQALPDFLTTLCTLHHLISPRERRLIQFPEYQDSYYDTALFPPDSALDDSSWKMIEIASDYQALKGLLINKGKYGQSQCFFHLEIVTPDFKPNFYHMVRVYDIQADPQPGQEGITYHFKAKGLFNYLAQEVVGEIKGHSCYPIALCKLEKGSMLVYKLCYLTNQDSIFNVNISPPRVRRNVNSMGEAINKLIHPIWRPQSIFGIEITTRDKLTQEPTGSGTNEREIDKTYRILFRTAGPPGHFHQYKSIIESQTSLLHPAYAPLQMADKEDEFKLKSLKYYIDMDKSYPNADGRLTMAKPIFWSGAKFLLSFFDNYVYAMYSDWDYYEGIPEIKSEMLLNIIDPTDNPDNPLRFEVVPEWEIDQNPRIRTDISSLRNFQENGEPCVKIPTIATFGMRAVFHAPHLKPQKTYSALFLARFGTNNEHQEREVHRYVFTTSRYKSFEEQVNSYRIPTGIDPNTGEPVFEEAIHDVQLALTNVEIGIIQSILDENDPEGLHKQNMHIYDRLMNAGFGMPPQEAPLNTEFNIIRGIGGRTFGILVKNPEPFNDPKIPIEVLNDKQVIEVKIPFSSDNNEFRYVYSKDLSSVFITLEDNSLDMSPGYYSFTFRYLEYDQDVKDYKEASVVTNLFFKI